MGPSMSRAFHHIVQIMTLGLIVATLNVDTIVASDTIDAFIIPLLCPYDVNARNVA
jgi:hypothetical protein